MGSKEHAKLDPPHVPLSGRTVRAPFWVFAVGLPLGAVLIVVETLTLGRTPIARIVLAVASSAWGIRDLIMTAATLPRVKPRIRASVILAAFLHALFSFGFAALVLWKV
jgi:hypothetical protein